MLFPPDDTVLPEETRIVPIEPYQNDESHKVRRPYPRKRKIIIPIFICEKCGKLDTSANDNNFWQSQGNQYRIQLVQPIIRLYADSYFDTHSCCAKCCSGLRYVDGSLTNCFGDKDGWVSKVPYTEMSGICPEDIFNWDYIMMRGF